MGTWNLSTLKTLRSPYSRITSVTRNATSQIPVQDHCLLTAICGGEQKYWTTGNFCSQTFTSAVWGWCYTGVWPHYFLNRTRLHGIYFLTSLARTELAACKIIPSMVRNVRDFRRGGSLGFSETSVKHYQPTLRKIPEGRRSHDTQQSICSIHNFDKPPSIISTFR